jgi:REP element-mobilizing transposase RayT
MKKAKEARDFDAVSTRANWKHWTAHEFRFQWQRDFFEHRLRDNESFLERLDYVLQNPVRAGLVADWEDWPFTWVSSEQTR